MPTFTNAALALAAVASLQAPVAPPPGAATPPVERPIARAVRAQAPPAIDGNVLDDPAWAVAPVLSDFWQTAPEEGRPASEKTDVRILYTADTLYVGVVCHDREPERIVVAQSRRDAPLDDGDSFQMVLDTYHDGQNGFVFATNPNALEHDGQLTREGQQAPNSTFQQTGAGGGYNLNWDAAWQVKALRGEFGWSAEFAIPFRTLRYAGGGTQAWGLNFQRNIRRRNETAYWAPLTRQYNLYRVSQAGVLQGLELEPQKNLKVSPYALGRATRDYQSGGRRAETGDVGGDLKYSLTPSLTLDATVNTDFAQVEVDEEQVNLNRFNLFFPEKRPFFLENAGLFAAGTPTEVELFFSRRIGIGPGGEVVPIRGGARLSGRIAGFNVGLLNMQTSDVRGGGTALPANNFTVARFGRELENRSGFGALFVNRQATGSLAGDDNWNRTFAVDGRVGIGRYTLADGWAAITRTPGVAGGQGAYYAGVEYLSPGWDIFARYAQVEEHFNPEAGFLSRAGYRKPSFLVFRQKRLTNGPLGLFEIRPHVSYTAYFKPGGYYESGFAHVDNHFAWSNGAEIHTAMNVTHEGVQTPFEIHPGIIVPVGRYDHKEFQLYAFTDQGKPLSASEFFVSGGFFGGHNNSLTTTGKARLGKDLSLDVSHTLNDVSLPAGDFTVNLLRTRVSYSFSPRVFVQALIQYNDVDDRFSTNLRFGWLQSANTGLFVVYNESRDSFTSRWPVQDRVVTVKFSRLFDLLN